MTTPASTDRRPSRAGAGVLLDLVRRRKATTKTDLAEHSGLARATVNARLAALVDGGLLLPDGTARSTGGRRPERFLFNAQGGVALVAALGASAGRFACCDLDGAVLVDVRERLDIAAGPAAVLPIVRDRLAHVLATAGRTSADVRGVAIGVPGPVEAAAGRVVDPPIMTGWDGVDIPAAAALPWTPVLVENDVNLMVLGEQRTRLRAEENIVFVKVGTGVGSGVMVFDRLYRGSRGAAGDIGHIPLAEIDEDCRCGNRGCVEAAAGGWALARDLHRLGHDVHDSAGVVALLRTRHPDAVRLVTRAGRLLGTAIAGAVSFLNPSVVVLGGDIADADDRLLAAVREIVYSHALPLATQQLRLDVSQLGERAGVVGGAHLVVEHVFAPAAVDRLLARR